MTFSELGKSGLAMLMNPSGGNPPRYIDLDLGSQSISTSTSGLNSAAFERAIDTFDNSVLKEITDTANWNSVELSGSTVYGFGAKENSGESGANWMNVNWSATGSINFDGSKELQQQMKVRFQ